MIFIPVAGWITISLVMLALLNFVLKQISRDYVKGLHKDYKAFTDAYRRFMQHMIRRHRYFGVAALASFLVHAGLILFFSFGIALTGLITGVLLSAVVSLGGYGYYVNKDIRSWWVAVHRGCAFALMLSALVHVFSKVYV
ncbi:MAG TPA: DUF4405 domain-containing protein [Deltaproteobacteria bacterium]|nr:DUF4405 domain-containing protein [Deltaproteobacteria bacterium]